MAADSRLAWEYLDATIRRPRPPVHFVATAGHSRGLLPLHRADLYAVSAIAHAGGQSTLRSIHLSPLQHLQNQLTVVLYSIQNMKRKQTDALPLCTNFGMFSSTANSPCPLSLLGWRKCGNMKHESNFWHGITAKTRPRVASTACALPCGNRLRRVHGRATVSENA